MFNDDLRFFVPIFAFFLLILIATPFYVYLTGDTETVTVEDKERIGTGEDSKYLVWTDEGTFENTDSFLHMKFDSSDVYGEMEDGKEYKIEYYGWRVPFLSMYPNITSVKEVD